MDQFDEQAFTSALKSSDQGKKAFEMLIENYSQSVYMLIRRMVLSHEDANDLTQECFIKVWKSLHSFRGESKAHTWLYRIASNTALNFIRSKKRLYHVSLDQLQSDLPQALDSDPLFCGDKALQQLQVAIAALPEKQKAVFIMRYYDELPFQEISDITGTSVGALKANYHHAAKKIEEALRRQIDK